MQQVLDPAAVDASLPARTTPAWTRVLSNFVVSAAEHMGAMLVAFEIALLSAAVIWRYVLNAPLIWSDELAELVIIWQAMLGAVVAFHKAQHLGLNVFTRRLPESTRETLETACTILIVLLSAPLAYYAFQHARADFDLLTPALEMSPSWRTGALVAGLGLIALLGLVSLVQRAREKKSVLLPLVAIGAALACLYLARQQFAGLGNLNLIIFFVVLGGGCMLIGVPIAFAFGIAAVAYVLLATNATLTIVPARMEAGMAHILLLSVPLFIALGAILEVAGMARRLVEFLASLVGHVKAGLSYVLVGAMVLVSGISGSKAADMAAIVPVLFPEMRKRGAKDGEMISLLAACSAMTETIPPSLVLIMTGAITGVSIGALFTAGWLPALVLAAMLCALARWRAGRSGEQGSARLDRGTVGKLAVVALPVLVLPFIIRGAVVEGVATATEVATIGIGYVLFVTLAIYRKFDWGKFYGALKEASVLTGVIFIILATANAMAWGFVQSGFSATLSAVASALPGGAYGFLLISIVIFVVLGSILEGIPAIVLLGPLLFPVAKALHISEVHYAIVAVLSMGLGLFAPPFGVGFYTACAIAKINPSDAIKAIWPYLAVIFAGVVLVAFVPWISTGFLK